MGAALLFWGYMMDQLILGGVMALLLEGAHWTRLRWDFDETSFLRARNLSVLLIAGAMPLIWMDGGNRFELVPRMLGWGPVFVFPFQFVEAYGVRQGIPLHVFSFFGSRKWQRNLRLGFVTRPKLVHFGHVYVVVALVASILTKQDWWQFLAGMLFVFGWQLLSLRRGAMGVAVGGLVLTALFAVGGQYGLIRLESWVTNGRGEDGRQSDAFSSMLGKLGVVKQSTEIMWRMKTLQGESPPLLHTAIFNQFYRGRWSLRRMPEVVASNTEFNPLGTREPVLGQIYHVAGTNAGPEAFAPDLPRVSLRGSANDSREGGTLPTPGNFSSFTGFDVDSVERNALGTIRIFPKESVIDGIEIWNPAASPDLPPWIDSSKGVPFKPDLKIEQDDAAAIHAAAARLDLKALPLDRKLAAIRLWFSKDFRYTRHGVGPLAIEANKQTGSELSRFLNEIHAGHCEYFATAATLMLRDAGVPARYVVGFAAMEWNPARSEHLIRGIHAHAWSRVWDESASRWIDFDPTPPDWLGTESPVIPWYQGIQDWIQQAREDFFIWRNQPGNRLLGGSIIGFIALAGLAVIVRSLWKSRRLLEEKTRIVRPEPALRTPLHDLEPLARKLLGERPPGTPFGRWLSGLRDHLPSPAGLDEAIAIHQRIRFDPVSDVESMIARLSVLERAVRNELAP